MKFGRAPTTQMTGPSLLGQSSDIVFFAFHSRLGYLAAVADQLLKQAECRAVNLLKLEQAALQSAKAFTELLNIEASEQGDWIT